MDTYHTAASITVNCVDSNLSSNLHIVEIEPSFSCLWFPVRCLVWEKRSSVKCLLLEQTPSPFGWKFARRSRTKRFSDSVFSTNYGLFWGWIMNGNTFFMVCNIVTSVNCAAPRYFVEFGNYFSIFMCILATSVYSCCGYDVKSRDHELDPLFLSRRS
jgi:hypothetical protein